MKRHFMFMDCVKMAALSRLIYKLNIISIKISEIDKLTLKFMWRCR